MKKIRKKESTIKGTKWVNTNFTKDSYKSENAYLKAFYKKNKGNMNGVSFSVFKERISKYKKTGMNITEALRSYGSTMTFMTQDEIAKYSAEAYMKRKEINKLGKLGGGEKEYYVSKKGKKMSKWNIKWDEFKYSSKTKEWIHASGKFGFRINKGKNSWEEDWIEVFEI